MNSYRKTNYFYIDESGSISNDSKVFIHGCIKTDSPKTITEALLDLKKNILSSLYYEEFKETILKQGFHATENSMDLRAELYKLLPHLNYRAYFVITNKESTLFNDLMKTNDESSFFSLSLKKLITDRIIANRNDKNIFYFETIELKKEPLGKILEKLFKAYEKEFDCEFYIVGKEEENLAIIDYLNYIFYNILNGPQPMPRMKQNFAMVAPKIGVVQLLHNNSFFSRKKKPQFQIELKNILEKY